jgi:uncharacterized protein YdaU (DUF1376 family)
MGTWYRRDWDVALEDVRALTPEEHGLYDRVVLLIHKRGGMVPDDDAFIAGWCNCEPRAWRRARARLIALEKLYETRGGLRSRLADPEVAETRRRHLAAQAAGRASALNRRTAMNEINDLGSAPVAEDPPVAQDAPSLASEPPDEPAIRCAEAAAQAEIAAHLDGKNPFELQDMVADLLQAMGHLTTVAPPGPDGGTDVLAYREPLGAPCIRGQVKHRTAPVGRDAIASLRGILRPGETGLFVSISGYTPEAVREAEGGAPIRLIDRETFVALWITHYDALSDAARDRMRLRPVHFLDADSSAFRHGRACPGHPRLAC